MTSKEKQEYFAKSYEAIGEFYKLSKPTRYRDSLVRVFGAIYHWCDSNGGQSRIDQGYLAFKLNTTREILNRRIQQLIKDDLVIDLTPDAKSTHTYKINLAGFRAINRAWNEVCEDELERRKALATDEYA